MFFEAELGVSHWCDRSLGEIIAIIKRSVKLAGEWLTLLFIQSL